LKLHTLLGALLPRNPKVAIAAPLLALAAFAAALPIARDARAGNMDITPERLSYCSMGAGMGTCTPNNVGWSNLMSELGMAIAPTAFHSARTTGLGGFALSFEASFTHVNANASAGGQQYWHLGTQGAPDPNTKAFPAENDSPDSLLAVYSLKARKGLAYGFEIAGDLGYLASSSLWVGGADVRWAILEGYRTGLLGYFPDIAIGGGVRTLGGSPKFFLTTVGLDAQISKPIALDDSAVLTPYIGAQRVIIFADSSVVDLTPSVDPLNCGYLGPNVPGNPNVPKNLGGRPANTGMPICTNSSADFDNDTTFNRARIHRWRWIAGLNYRFEVLYLAGQFAMDLTDPGAENSNLGVNGSKQWTTSLEAGLSF
jgi:hypothetical protein